MSTISEVDIRDWDRVDVTNAYMNANTLYEDVPEPLREYAWQLRNFIGAVIEVRNKQLQQSTKRIPALFRKGEE